MVKINRIYTKTGDTGETGLIGGARVRKDSLRVDAYGEIDELNSYLGLARTLAEREGAEALSERLARLQNDLFDLGSQLASPPGETQAGMPEIGAKHIERLESWIDELCANLPELRSFVLPGGTQLNGVLHVARAVCRRCERSVLALSRREPVPQSGVIFLNRLSDLLFAMARAESHRSGVSEYLWIPGKG